MDVIPPGFIFPVLSGIIHSDTGTSFDNRPFAGIFYPYTFRDCKVFTVK
jgi:hypothetical protein